jgi:hypothetical protein
MYFIDAVAFVLPDLLLFAPIIDLCMSCLLIHSTSVYVLVNLHKKKDILRVACRPTIQYQLASYLIEPEVKPPSQAFISLLTAS